MTSPGQGFLGCPHHPFHDVSDHPCRAELGTGPIGTRCGNARPEVETWEDRPQIEVRPGQTRMANLDPQMEMEL